ncbi:bifunctional aldolase/short-chain dehydrogenase [Defluviicoccus vanus]|uniref:Bifunctional aldolase/short-chain dehydrogenase n=1 Tax=Defluviicoccus vanus TaxID=111831 RepID=A0A7H1N432_9PROT|nr:bifunctional aldolase/short-chain dehydrogenase [Defluviicoccus vanus]QNT70468.1 bifunctional aldolase/short-chain dehydrogenase [Defluviicoccus vanus]
MENRWSDRDAEAAVERYTKQGVSYDLALRTYSTRLLGSEPRLVIHGGGNTSVKTEVHDATGESVKVLCVKGSGWDMATIEPAGLPAVRLQPLRRLADLETLTDEAMVNLQRVNLLDASAPNPSVETLLHAFLPFKYIDHTHANAVLALTDQPNGELLCRQIYGERMALVPYIMPGFQLAKRALAVFRQHPEAQGMILLKHGIFTFGDTARQAYERMLEMVTLAEERIAEAKRVSVAGVHLPRGMGHQRPKALLPVRLPGAMARVAQVVPLLRGLLAMAEGPGNWRRWVLDFRAGAAVEEFVNGQDLARYSQRGTATPDHVIRTKRLPLLLPPPTAEGLSGFAAQARTALEAYIAAYRTYFVDNNERVGRTKKPLDPMPRVLLVPGLGLFGVGASKQEARIAADLAETNIEVITAAETMDAFESISAADAFDMEYWSLEQAKLGKTAAKPLARHVVVITGGGSGIGAATALAFRAEGAEVAVLDQGEAAAGKVARQVGGISVVCDVTDPEQVAAAFDRVVEAFGGVDIVVSNAGGAWQGRIGDVDNAILRQSFELNFWAHQTVAQRAVAIMRAQATGGCLLFNASKQALNPGPDFGPYGLPKAAMLALMRQYALDHGRDRIRANAVNADRVRTGLLTPQLATERAKARGVSVEEYMAGNLLGLEVTVEDVARAFVHLALSPTTTAAVLTVDGGNIAAAVR